MHVIALVLIVLSVATCAIADNADSGLMPHLQKRDVVSIQPRLINEPVCQNNLKSLCASTTDPNPDDLSVLQCVQTFLTSQVEELPDGCQHMIWSHISSFIDDENIRKLTQANCANEFDKIKCHTTKEPGQYLACALGQLEAITEKKCKLFIQRLESIAFSDFRIIGPFVKSCEGDIAEFGCGRLVTDRLTSASQGETLECLQNHVDQLKSACKKEILHLSEMQSTNIKFDHQLYSACRADSEQFCPDAKPGQGLLFKCLVRNKHSELMSRQCQKQIARREKLIAHDYRVSKGLTRACRDDIKSNHCRRGVSEDKDVRLAQILLCLESAHKNNTKVAPECLSEMADHRRLLMDDYKLSPEILRGCADDIEKFCGNTVGNTIHCLMERARSKKKRNRVTSQCQAAIEKLVNVADAGEDWRVDPLLRKACKSVVDEVCHEMIGGDASVMSCLMDKLGTSYMREDCESALMQIQYFVARDFKLDPQLYKHCKSDAVRFCNAKRQWTDLDNELNVEHDPLILPCLHRYAYHESKDLRLKPECFQEVKRVMRQRAISVDLIPEVEDKCLDDLSLFCFDRTEKGSEIQCLQDNLDKLDSTCKTAVSSYTEEQSAHIELNPIIMKYCHNVLETNCASVSRDDKGDGEIMECLISHKNDPALKQAVKCRAAIEHFQIISLKNYHFTNKFKMACRPLVLRFCQDSSTKPEVIGCLSEIMRNDTIKGQQHSITKECRQQIRLQLYQQRENIEFDPKLWQACKMDMSKLCGTATHGAGKVLECLQTANTQLSPDCRHKLFAVKKSELTDSSTDYTLVHTCKEMLMQYCHDRENVSPLDCLRMHKDRPQFDQSCHLIVVNRMIEQNIDYRFNPALQTACSRNIADHCTEIVAHAKQNEELNGKVVSCLKAKFREGKLTNECKHQMTEVLREQALNYKLDPLLQSVCQLEIAQLCKGSDSKTDEAGEVEECLKIAFLSHQIISRECKVEVANLIEEARADIQVDPLLQRACTNDLMKYCSNVQSGNGRHLRCLQVILDDESKALEQECKTKLRQRIEMFKNAEPFATPPKTFQQLYSQVAASPAKKYLLLVMLTCVGMVFIFGLFCGYVTKRRLGVKNK